MDKKRTIVKSVSIKGREYTPLNKTAAMVSGEGEDYEFELHMGGRWYSKTPIPTKFFHNKLHNLTGKKIGSLTVVGYLGHRKAGSNMLSKWLVRCVCGWYTIRNGHKLKKKIKKGESDECIYCNKKRQVREGHY
jgi:hypothetical protein